jgi:hypothetical protein
MVIPNFSRTAQEEALIAASQPVALAKPAESGKVGRALLWLLGVPLPVLLVAYLIFHH